MRKGSCALATYPDFRSACEARRIVHRTRFDLGQARIPLLVKKCVPCEQFHIHVDPRWTGANKRHVDIMRYIALGFRNAEIAKAMSLTEVQVIVSIRTMVRKFGAMSRAHLVALAIGCGAIDSTEILSTQQERLPA